MKRIFLFIISTVGICGSALAGSVIKDPIYDYLFDHGNITKVCYLAQMQRVLLLKLDLDNTGRQSIVISLNGYGGKTGSVWEAYIPYNGGYQRADKNLYFREDRFYVGYVDLVKKYGLLAYELGKGGGDLNFFQIVNGKVTMQKVGELNPYTPEGGKEMETYFGKAPEWKSLKEHPVTTMSLDDLKKAGYNVDAAISDAKNFLKSYRVPTK